MACSIDDAYKKVQDKPSLALSVATTPLGILGLLFFIVTSMEGVKSFTGADSIFAIFSESWKGIKSLLAPLVSRSVSEAKSSTNLGRKELLIWVLSLIVVAALLISLASDDISWLSVMVAVLLGGIFVALIGRYTAPKWLRAVTGGAIVGASIGLIVFLIRQGDSWSSKKLLPDVLFVLLLVYFILAGLALWNNYIVPRATEAVLFRKN